MIDQLAEKYNVSKSGIYIIAVLFIAIIGAFFLVPDKSFKPTPIKVGARGMSGAADQGKSTPQASAPEDIAQQAAAPAPAPAPTPAPAPVPQPPAPVAPAPAPAPAPAAVAAVPAAAPSTGRIRRENPFAPIFGQATQPAAVAIAPPPEVSYPSLSLPPDVRMSMLPPQSFMPVVEPTFILSGIYLSNSGRNVAIVNDLRVTEGDKIGETGFRVENIDTSDLKQVTLKNGAGKTITLDFGSPSPSELVTSPTGTTRSTEPPPPLPATGNP